MRAAAVRFVLAFLMGFLLAPFSGTSPAEAHASAPEVRATGLPDATVGETHRAYATCGAPDRGGESNGLLRHRDRHRSATLTTPATPSRAAVTGETDGMLTPAAVAAMGNAHRISRSSIAHSSPGLQVFRC